MSLAKLGLWLRRRTRDCYDRLAEAKEVLGEVGVDEEVLSVQWEAQVAYQTTQLPREFPDLGMGLHSSHGRTIQTSRSNCY